MVVMQSDGRIEIGGEKLCIMDIKALQCLRTSLAF